MSEKPSISVGLAALVTLTLVPAPPVLGGAGDSRLRWHTYAGSSVDDKASGVAVDPMGKLLVTGSTASTNFPVVSGLEGALAGGGDAFVTKIDTASPSLDSSPYLGGAAPQGTSPDDYGYAIAADAAGNAVVTGYPPYGFGPTASEITAPCWIL